MEGVALLMRRFIRYNYNGVSLSRIDMVLVLEDWSENCGTFSLWALHRDVSDLCPFILKATNIDWGSKTS
jgi:hypothetical protein